jgi:CBS domain-containing protein
MLLESCGNATWVNVVDVEETKKGPVPIGIITDRDIVIGTAACGLEPSPLTVAAIISKDLVTISED